MFPVEHVKGAAEVRMAVDIDHLAFEGHLNGRLDLVLLKEWCDLPDFADEDETPHLAVEFLQ